MGHDVTTVRELEMQQAADESRYRRVDRDCKVAWTKGRLTEDEPDSP
jgi:hypothetical protein